MTPFPGSVVEDGPRPGRMTPLTQVLGGLAASFAAALGGLSLLAWHLGGLQMARLGPDGIAMGPNTALFLLVLGTSLSALILRPASRGLRALGLAGSALAFLGTVLGVVQWAIPLPLPWDRWLGGETHVGVIVLGRMPLTTVSAFLLASIALAAQSGPFRNRRAALAAGTLSGAASGLIGLVEITRWASGTPRYLGGQAAPMAVLTGAAFALLSLGLLTLARADKAFRRWLNPAEEAPFSGAGGRIRRWELAAILAVGVFLVGAALIYVRREQSDARQAAYQQLDAVAGLKTAQIAEWREDRLSEARFLLGAQDTMRDAVAFISKPGEGASRAHLIDWLDRIRDRDRYHSVLVFGRAGDLVLASGPAGAPGTMPPIPLDKVLDSQDVVIADLYRGLPDGKIYLDLVVPIRPPTAPKGASAAGAIVLRVDPDRVLFPMVGTWPVPSETAEALLVRREGEEVVYLTQLRHRPEAALNLRRPLSEPYLPAAIGLRSDGAVREGLDYRGTPVLAATRRVPGTPWLLVAKIDQREVYAAVRREASQTAAMVGLLIAGILLASSFAWRRRQSASLLRALAAESESKVMAERLALVTRHANDIILLTDADGRVVEANDRALSTYGHTLEELRDLPLGGLRPPEAVAETAEHLRLIDQEDGAVFETLHRRKDGSIFPVEVSGRRAAIGGETRLLLVIRDVTLRKKHEAEIERLNRLYAAHSHVNQAIVHAETRDVLLREVCRSLVESGRFVMAWVGWPDPTGRRIAPVAHFGDAAAYLGDIRITIDSEPEGQGPTGTAFREGRTVVANDLQNDPRTRPWHETARRAGYRSAIALPIRVNGATSATLTVYAAEAGFFGAPEIALIEEAALDVGFGLASLELETQRARAEEALSRSLHEKEALLQEVHHRVKNNLQVIASLLRLETGRAGESSTRVVLKEMQGRIRSMALLHETLYRTGNFARVDLADYLRQLANQLFRMQNTDASRVRLEFDLGTALVDIDQAIPCGLIVNELLTNSLKYAFPGDEEGRVWLRLRCEPEGRLRLSVEDTGPGLPGDFEARRGSALGLQLVSDLARQLGGTLEVGAGPGASFGVAFTPHPIATSPGNSPKA
ncbi:MAG: GAF domain-containing protein [Vicinamibacteria bacterium]|nr:GAF domain-containing protein [Vicinamibacteria bacterium]